MEQKLVVGIVGLKMGRGHLEAVLKYEGAEVGAICDINPAKLNEVGDQYNIPVEKRFTDYMDLVNNPEINVVLIVTPDQIHREMSEKFLAAGKHVMCEKPLALTREDLVAINAAAKKANTVFMVGQICRFTPSFVAVKKLIEDGVIGDLYFVESEYAHDYAKFLWEWRQDPLRHGVIGGGCHAIDLLRWYAGDPEEVFAYGTHKLLQHVKPDDTVVSVIKFPNNVIGKVMVSISCKRPYTMRTVVYGTKGTIIVDNTSDSFTLYTLLDGDISVNPEPQIIPCELNNHNCYAEFCALVEAIKDPSTLLMTADQGARTVAVGLAIVESSKTGKPVQPDYNF